MTADQRKITVTLPEELCKWLIEEAQRRGVRKTTLLTILASECRARQIEMRTAQELVEKLKFIPEDKLKEMFGDGLIGQTTIK
jgi:hypothetical protein